MRKFDLFFAAFIFSCCPRRRRPARRGKRADVLAGSAPRSKDARRNAAPRRAARGRDRGGADPDSELRALGADRFYQLNRTVDGTGVTILTDRPIRDFAPASWRVVDSYGEAAEALDHPQVDFLPFSERYVIASRSTSFRRNDAGCFRNLSHALLFEVPGAPASAEDANVPMLFRMLILAMDGQTICVRMDGDREHGYRSRYFLRRRALRCDRADELTIVPAARSKTRSRQSAARTTTDRRPPAVWHRLRRIRESGAQPFERP